MCITMNKLTYVLLTLCLLSTGCREEETGRDLQPVQLVKVMIPIHFLSSESAAGEGENTLRSTDVAPDTGNDFKLHAIDTRKTQPVTRSFTQFNNTWVLAFAEDGTCLSSLNAGEVLPDAPITASLPTGNNLTLYILANGPTVLDKPATLAQFEGPSYFSTDTYTNENEVPYVGKISDVHVDENGRLFNSEGTDIQVPLQRIAAKLALTFTVTVPDYTLESVRLFNAPTKMYYVYSNTDASITVDTLDAGIVSDNTYTWFIGENLRGTGKSKNQEERYSSNAPVLSTFIRVTLRSTLGVETVAYDIYPGKNLAQNYDLARNWDYIYTTNFNKNGSQLASDKRVYVENAPIDLTKSPSNCYILEPGKSYKFDPRIKGEGQEETGGTSIPIRHDAQEMRLLWQDTPSLVQSIGISSDHSIAVVNLTSGQEGNAVVAAYAGGKVVWSWHLWVRSKAIDKYTTNGVAGMACVLGALNLSNTDFDGATSRGLFYQWGRPTPFPRSNSVDQNTPVPAFDIENKSVIFDTSESPQSISWVIEHPTTFVTGGSWHTDGEDLWGNKSGKKTIFDPCPVEWKIPQDNTIWQNWTNNTSAPERFVWDASKYARMAYENYAPRSLYPAAGFYTNTPESHPQLVNVGYEGRYWSAIFSGSQGGVLRFTANVADSTNPDNNLVERITIDQTYGCSVRPVNY